MPIATISPVTGEVIQTFEPLSDGALEQKLTIAQQQFDRYRHTSFEQRSRWMLAAAEILQARKQEFGRIMTLEMGKTLKSAIAEVEKCVWVCRFYAEKAADFLADVPVPTDASHSYICYQPLGIVLAVMPWNFPFWQVFRFAAPALMAGNVGLLKHASNVPMSAMAIEAVFQEAGFPTGAFQTLLIGADRVASLVQDDRIKAATLTGSEPAGASLAAACGAQIKKVVLELGGSDPFVIMPSADLDTAISTAVTARMLNNGQSCIAAKRFIVAESIADRVEQRLVQCYQALKVGDPMQPETDIGPLATLTILKEIDHQVRAAVGQGCRIATGGQPLGGSGNFYPPTILADVPPDSAIAQEEFFGPVAMLFRAPDLDGAIRLANNIPFGLGASAWTNDQAEQKRFISDLEAGAVFINGMVKSDPRLPFGGIKRSGYGRELGAEGLREFVNVKTVWVK